MALFSAGSLAACTLTMLCAAGPVSPPPESALTLTVRQADGVSRAVQLLCDPDAGTHPKALEACTALEQADGNFDALATTRQPCPMIHAPVRATAHGHWRGKPVRHTADYSNPCLADAESSGVFGF
ncbi:SSI family serine proteinase inhibitor [Prauserella oleivorans]|uniref:SSI family serine proteinase inhibitor n=1 Tax=Prauserella oleivorans TaxID=1478153 RepID=A0ABW5W577_9PSEU